MHYNAFPNKPMRNVIEYSSCVLAMDWSVRVGVYIIDPELVVYS